ncbi:SPOR domain-containing protein [Echinicola soli]|uniref:SPOR domain-containing protein n=1 Tax=Echinicola soli TaxID=2591634 RepID=A0A514CFU0_9BACT|nr:SPOR domain-containing protein [Echinicola soli]QDH78683.1 SPOR domain-containing protein [Echinicola soli]
MVSKNLLRSGLVLGMFLALAINAHSQQLTKDKKKALKKELRKMSPEEYWLLKNQQQEQKVAIIVLEKENEDLKGKLAEQAEDLAIKQNKIEQGEDENVAMTDNEASVTAPSSKPVTSEWGKGVVFRVQIGALTEEEYQKEIPSGFSLDVEHKGDLKRMLVGHYRDYDEADSFKKLMRKLGIRTAWIVPYKDGKRVPLKEVLGEVVN